MKDSTFDFLRTLVEIILPALSTLYFGLAEIWHLPLASEICGTIAVIATFIGAFVNIQRDRFNKL